MRRRSIVVRVGQVLIGGDHPIAVQSMTNTETADVTATVEQIVALAEAGSELVRITVNTEAAARAVPEIVARVRERGVFVPIIGDFHYNGHLLLSRYRECARALDKYRINPGNVGVGRHQDENFRRMIEIALEYEKPIRIGVNWGSLDQALLTRLMEENARRPEPQDARAVMREAMIRSALDSAARAEAYGMPHDRIILSVKTSEVLDVIEVNRQLAARCDYPLHIGLTEAGMGLKGVVASATALGILLYEGIGDTIRVSVTPAPGGDRREEVFIAQQILQTLGLRAFAPQVSACPGCGRTTSTFFQEMAAEVQTYLHRRMPEWRRCYPGIENLRIAVMGCVVNGPGESKQADIGISLPGTGEEPKAPVFADGQLVATLRGPTLVADFLRILEDYIRARFGQSDGERAPESSPSA